MKQQIREKIWKELGSYGAIPPISKTKRLLKLLKRRVDGKRIHFTDTVSEEIAGAFESCPSEEAEIVVTGAVAASNSGACLGLEERKFDGKKVIAVVDSKQLVETDLYDFTADTIVTPHYVIDSKKVVGIDEAGRGCVIGPLVVGAVCVKKCELPLLKRMGACDSKTLSPRKREVLDKKIREMAEVFIEELPPGKIDGRNGSRKNLNRLEEEAFLSLIRRSGATIVFTDALSRNCKNLEGKLELNLDPNFRVTCSIRGDAKFPIIGAASIVAKVERDARIEALKKKYGDFGSGYCHDAKTNSFLSEFYADNRFFPPIVRRNWTTLERIKGELTQQTLG